MAKLDKRKTHILKLKNGKEYESQIIKRDDNVSVIQFYVYTDKESEVFENE